MRHKVEVELDQFVGPAFEVICQEYIWRRHAAGGLGFVPKTVGNWWDGQEEIDVVAIEDDCVLMGECKWTSRPVGVNILDALKGKAQRFSAKAKTQYALFARSGFTDELHALTDEREDVLLVDLGMIIAG